MDQQRGRTLEVRVAYKVEANGPQLKIADYTVRERAASLTAVGIYGSDETASGLLKPLNRPKRFRRCSASGSERRACVATVLRALAIARSI